MALRHQNDIASPRRPSPVKRQLVTASALRVLIVDDHPITRDGLRAALGSSNEVVVVAEATWGEEAVEAVRQAVLALPAHYREVVVLCDLEEMDYANAAAALGCSIGTVRSRLHRARESLRLLLAGDTE